jgi:hypothetical protein
MKDQRRAPLSSRASISTSLSTCLLIDWKMGDILIRTNLRSALFKSGHSGHLRRPRIIIQPLRATKDTGDASSPLALSPLLKASLVKVLTTSSFAPDNFLVRLHLEDTDGAVAFDRFAGTVVDALRNIVKFGSAGHRSVGKNFAQFVGEKGQLVLHIDWSFENDNESVYAGVRTDTGITS